MVFSSDLPALPRIKNKLLHCIKFYYELKMYESYRLINIDHIEVLETFGMGLKI